MNAYRICLRLSQSDNPSTYRPKLLFERLPGQKRSGNRRQSIGGNLKITNDWRFGPISVEWIDREFMPSTDPSSSSTVTQKSDGHSRGGKSPL